MNEKVQSGPVIILREEVLGDLIAAVVKDGAAVQCAAQTFDDEDVFVVDIDAGKMVFIYPDSAANALQAASSGARVLIRASSTERAASSTAIRDRSGVCYWLSSYVAQGCVTKPAASIVVPRNADVFERVRGVFDSYALRHSHVCILGVGSGGSFIARELAKAGVGKFTIVDSDRLELGNVCRHECGIRDIGRLKINAVAELLRNHSPGVAIESSACHISGIAMEQLRQLMQPADLVICATDNRESRLIVNRLALQEGKPAIYAGVFLRAAGGQVLRVIPDVTPCYQCFVSAVPGSASNNEVSSEQDSARLAYSDRPMPIEPGLSSDVMPVALHVIKLALVELLRSQETTLASLREDLVAPWYLWINRRDPRTEYAKWPPLEDHIDGMRILRWYGILLERQKGCPACGTPLDVPAADLEFFGA